MKPVFKYALASLALAVGSSGAYASVAVPSGGNSDLVLFVKDNSNSSRVFAVSLGVTVNSLLTDGGVGSTVGDNNALRDGTPINTSVALPTFHSDALQTFMQTASVGGYSFAILGGDSLGSNFITNPYRYVGTQTVQFDVNNVNTMNNGNLGNSAAGIGGNVNDLFSVLNQSLGASGTFVTDFSLFNGDNLAGAFNLYGTSFGAGLTGITASVGSATNLYMLTSSSTGTTGGGTATTRLYQFADVTLGANGTLTSASVGGPEVPLPAAVWLLGSALVGLGTVRRRRDAQAA